MAAARRWLVTCRVDFSQEFMNKVSKDQEYFLRANIRQFQLSNSISMLSAQGFEVISSRPVRCKEKDYYIVVEGTDHMITLWLLKYHHLEFEPL